MDTIWKFELEITDLQKVSIPRNCQLLSVANQDGTLCLWAMVDKNSPKTDIEIEIIGTGNPILFSGDFRRAFIGTVIIGDFVWHIFERVAV